MVEMRNNDLDRVVFVVIRIGVKVVCVSVCVPSVIKTIRHVAEDPGHVGDNLLGDSVHLLAGRGHLHPGVVTHALGMT